MIILWFDKNIIGIYNKLWLTYKQIFNLKKYGILDLIVRCRELKYVELDILFQKHLCQRFKHCQFINKIVRENKGKGKQLMRMLSAPALFRTLIEWLGTVSLPLIMSRSDLLRAYTHTSLASIEFRHINKCFRPFHTYNWLCYR